MKTLNKLVVTTTLLASGLCALAHADTIDSSKAIGGFSISFEGAGVAPKDLPQLVILPTDQPAPATDYWTLVKKDAYHGSITGNTKSASKMKFSTYAHDYQGDNVYIGFPDGHGGYRICQNSSYQNAPIQLKKSGNVKVIVTNTQAAYPTYVCNVQI